MDVFTTAAPIIVALLLVGALGAVANLWGADSRSTLNNDHNR